MEISRPIIDILSFLQLPGYPNTYIEEMDKANAADLERVKSQLRAKLLKVVHDDEVDRKQVKEKGHSYPLQINAVAMFPIPSTALLSRALAVK